ncbi:MAG: hypothetical protein MZU97_22635 [Bacillus subtilis]|nr:hypothetical protein [Bacillus subtilis]
MDRNRCIELFAYDGLENHPARRSHEFLRSTRCLLADFVSDPEARPQRIRRLSVVETPPISLYLSLKTTKPIIGVELPAGGRRSGHAAAWRSMIYNDRIDDPRGRHPHLARTLRCIVVRLDRLQSAVLQGPSTNSPLQRSRAS